MSCSPVVRPTILESLSDKALKDWVSANAGVGVGLEVLLKPLRQLSLEMMMETLSERDRDIEQTWLLLDHVNYSIASNLDDQVGIKISPSDFSSLAADRWETVLGDHYHETRLIHRVWVRLTRRLFVQQRQNTNFERRSC